jgi:hypothetical protein
MLMSGTFTLENLRVTLDNLNIFKPFIVTETIYRPQVFLSVQQLHVTGDDEEERAAWLEPVAELMLSGSRVLGVSNSITKCSNNYSAMRNMLGTDAYTEEGAPYFKHALLGRWYSVTADEGRQCIKKLYPVPPLRVYYRITLAPCRLAGTLAGSPSPLFRHWNLHAWPIVRSSYYLSIHFWGRRTCPTIFISLDCGLGPGQ